jgi:hypothetical protein
MKHLKRYKLFLEEVDDSIESKMAKEKMDTYNKYISEYSPKSKLIDDIYKNSKSTEEIAKKLEDLLGKTDVSSKEDRNPFLVEYCQVSKLKKQIEDAQRDNSIDKIKLDDFQQDISATKDADLKTSLNTQITDIRNRMGVRSGKITDYQKEITDSEKNLKDKMMKISKEMSDSIKKLSSEGQK